MPKPSVEQQPGAQPAEAAERGRLHGDHYPGNNSDSTLNWRPGELIVDEVQLGVPKDYTEERFVVWLGWYQWQRVHAQGEGAGPDNRVKGPTIEVLADSGAD